MTFGVLTDAEVRKSLLLNPSMTRNRRLLAIPFEGKDCPSRTNEFSHPDVCIGLTALAYRYGGLRARYAISLQAVMTHFKKKEKNTFMYKFSYLLVLNSTEKLVYKRVSLNASYDGSGSAQPPHFPASWT